MTAPLRKEPALYSLVSCATELAALTAHNEDRPCINTVPPPRPCLYLNMKGQTALEERREGGRESWEGERERQQINRELEGKQRAPRERERGEKECERENRNRERVREREQG